MAQLLSQIRKPAAAQLGPKWPACLGVKSRDIQATAFSTTLVGTTPLPPRLNPTYCLGRSSFRSRRHSVPFAQVSRHLSRYFSRCLGWMDLRSHIFKFLLRHRKLPGDTPVHVSPPTNHRSHYGLGRPHLYVVWGHLVHRLQFRSGVLL